MTIRELIKELQEYEKAVNDSIHPVSDEVYVITDKKLSKGVYKTKLIARSINNNKQNIVVLEIGKKYSDI